MNKEEEKANIKSGEDEAKKIIAEQLNKLDINDVITNTIATTLLPVVKETLERIDTIEVEGKRVRIKFK